MFLVKDSLGDQPVEATFAPVDTYRFRLIPTFTPLTFPTPTP